MAEDLANYGLDMHCTMILEEYRAKKPMFDKMLEIVKSELRERISEAGLYVTAIEARVKDEASLAGKLELKGSKYRTLSDVTDILGARVITFYTDEVDKIAAMMDKCFVVDYANSVDKRKMHQLDSFGYNSLHYVCRIPKSMYFDPEYPEFNEQRFELQMRTALQHVWATINHDIGYKSGVEVPYEYLRNINRLAGMLELADEQFSTIRTNINNYRREVQSLVASGRFDEVPLNGDTFKSYLKLRPFDKLAGHIAAINQAEIHECSSFRYLEILQALGLKTIGDVERFIKDNSDDAFQLAVFQIGNTDLDIIASTVAVQDLCVVHVLKAGGGPAGLAKMFDVLDGESEYNRIRAEEAAKAASQLSFMQNR